AFSRTARTELRRTKVDLGEMVRGCIKDLEQEVNGRNVQWNVAKLPQVHADPSLLKQVFINLLNNALKYTRRRETALIEVGGRLESGEHLIWVRDNGVGFDPRYAHKLFGVF